MIGLTAKEVLESRLTCPPKRSPVNISLFIMVEHTSPRSHVGVGRVYQKHSLLLVWNPDSCKETRRVPSIPRIPVIQHAFQEAKRSTLLQDVRTG